MTKDIAFAEVFAEFKSAIVGFRRAWAVYRAQRHLTKAARIFIAAGEISDARAVADLKDDIGS